MKEIIAAALVLSAVVGLVYTLPSINPSADTEFESFADLTALWRLDGTILPLSYVLEITPFFVNVSLSYKRSFTMWFLTDFSVTGNVQRS